MFCDFFAIGIAIIFHGMFSDKCKRGLRYSNLACTCVSERDKKTITLEAITMFDLKNSTIVNWIHSNQVEQIDFISCFT